MKDRFKFRAWDKTNNDWAICGVFLDKVESDRMNEAIDKNLYLNIRNDDIVIMQCTGLKDKTGKLIYEGDVLEYQNGLNDEDYHVVEWIKKKSAFYPLYRNYGNEIITKNGWGSMFYKIIGNIYSNPELL